jgi:WD40 repeat protein
MWNVHTADVSLLIPEAAEGCTIEALAVHPDNRTLACGGIDFMATSGSDGAVCLWDTVERKKLATFPGGANGLAFAPDGSLLAAGGPGENIRLYDVAGRQLVRELRASDDGVTCLTFSPDGRFLIAGSNDHALRIWDVASGERLATHEMNTPIKAIRFSPDGGTIYTGNGNTTCYCLDSRRTLEG